MSKFRTRGWPTYNPAATCPKCSHDDVGSLYREGWVYRYPQSDKGEWIERICRRCHYCWPEECAVLTAPVGADGGAE